MDLGGWGGEEGLGGSRRGEMVIRIDQNIFYEISLFSTKNKRGERERKGDAAAAWLGFQLCCPLDACLLAGC